MQVVTLADYDHVEEVTREGVKKAPSPGYPLVCVTSCDPHFPKYAIMKERCSEAGINQTSVQFSWEVASPTDGNGARSPFETVTDNTPFTSVNHMVSLGARSGCAGKDLVFLSVTLTLLNSLRSMHGVWNKINQQVNTGHTQPFCSYIYMKS